MSDRSTLAERELEGREFIPYLRHVEDHVIALRGRSLMTMLAIDGFAFETADTRDINGLHFRLNTLWRNIADHRLAVYAILLRRRSTEYPEGTFGNAFAAGLDAKYRQRMAGQTLYRNDHYLALVWAPGIDVGEKASALMATLKKAAAAGIEVDAESVKRLEDATATVASSLAPLGVRQLGLVERNAVLFSEMSLVLHRLLGGRMPLVPLTMGTVGSAILSDRVIIGKETIEFRYPGATSYAAMLGMKEYPARTRPGMFDELLSVPFEVTAVQSFRFIDKATARGLMSRKQNQMVNVADKAFSQVAELSLGLDDLESNRWVLGEHHLSVAVFAPTVKLLADYVSQARNAVANGGAVIVREDLGLEAAWWAQLPGNFRYRKRSGSITSANFAGLAPLHSYPLGKQHGNAWGAAVALLKTPAGSPFYFNFHHNDLGNTFICGPSGSGKTVILNFMLSQLLKHAPRMVFFDKDRGSELFVRAAGGVYLALRNGRSTGFAPLQAMSYDAAGRGFLTRWIGALAGRPLTVEEEASLTRAVATLGDGPKEMRTMGQLRVYLDDDHAEGLSARLARWERTGPLGWVFDNDEDFVGEGQSFVGFDMTDFLDNPEVRTPMMMYLFQRVESWIDGRRIVISIDEFWKALGDEAFRDLASNKLKTIRKQNGLMLFATQSPADALRSPIAHTIIEQCPTQIFFPNGRASEADYIGGMKLTSREFGLVARGLTVESRRFLVKQGHASVVAELDLSGFDDELAILSGRTSYIELLETIRAEVGDAPASWLDVFHQRRRAA